MPPKSALTRLDEVEKEFRHLFDEIRKDLAEMKESIQARRG